MVTKPTCEELYDGEGFQKVYRSVDDGWRHGVYVTQVFKCILDDTYWMAEYRLSTDGYTNELREGLATIHQVRPVEVATTAWNAVMPMED